MAQITAPTIRPSVDKPTTIPKGCKWCPGCAAVLDVTAFGPDRSRPPLFLQGRCRGCVSRANSRRKPTAPTPQQYASKLVEGAKDHSEIFEIPCDVSAQMLQPFPPICVLTLDDLIEGDAPQAPSLAMLVDGPGFTEENSVVISARARRRHQVIGAKAIRDHLGNADVLPVLTVATLTDALFRHNRLAWATEAAAIASEIADVACGADAFLEVPREGRKAKDAQAVDATRQNWADLIDGNTYSRPSRSAEQYAQFIGWSEVHMLPALREWEQERAIV